MLNYNHLFYFHVIASEGSLKGASERLGVTQPTLSEQLRSLERALSVQLFDRVSGGLRLTQVGREVFDHTTHMFLAGERLAAALGRSGAMPRITLRVGISASIARTMAADFLMPVLTIEQCYPLIRTGESIDLWRDLRSHDLDLVIAETEPLDNVAHSFQTTLISRPKLVAVASPDAQPSERWENMSLLDYRTTSAYHFDVQNYLQDRGLCPRSAGETDDAFLMLEAAARGGFIAFVPHNVARGAIKDGHVIELATIEISQTGIYAVYPASEMLDVAQHAVNKLIESAHPK